ncbi:MAG: hypothetical protein LBO05_00200 [Deltaproteobacteria bacterium]|jgi:hypothetical protein|nr:hypothetical protein [Deltaproteobacteria bacterium]
MNYVNKYFLSFLNHLAAKSGRGFSRYLSRISSVDENFISKILNGKVGGSETTKRKITTALGYMYDDFLARGQAIVEGRDPDSVDEIWAEHMGDDLRERGFTPVQYSDNMRLKEGSGGIIPVTDSYASTKVVVHAPSLGCLTGSNLQAFRVGDGSMEPLIAEGSVVMADLTENDIGGLKEGKIYIVCPETQKGECVVKFIRWAEKDRSIILSSQNSDLHPPFMRPVDGVLLVGRVIFAWREFQ